MAERTKSQLLAEIEMLQNQIGALRETVDAMEDCRRVIDDLPLGLHIYRLQADGRLMLQRVNSAAERIQREDISQSVGDTAEAAFPVLDPTGIFEHGRRIAREGGTWQGEITLEGESEAPRSFEITTFQCNPYTAAAVFQDITKRVDGQRHLREERDITATVLNTVDALVIVLDLDGRIVRFNRACEALTGYTSAEVLGKQFAELLLMPEERDGVGEVFDRLAQGECSSQYENHWLTRTGEQRLISWSNATLASPDGVVQYVMSTGVDVTVQRRAQEEVAARSKFEALITGIARRFINLPTTRMREGILQAITEVGEFMGVDRSAVWLFSEDLSEVHFMYEWIRPGSLAEPEHEGSLATEPYAALVEELKAGKVFAVKSTDRLAEQHEGLSRTLRDRHLVSWISVPIRERESLVGYMALGTTSEERDWSESTVTLLRVMAEIIANMLAKSQAIRGLQDSQSRLALVFSGVSDLITLLAVERGEQYRFAAVNRAFSEHRGIAPEEVDGKLLQEVPPVSEHQRRDMLGRYAKVLETRQPVSFERRKGTGEDASVLATEITPILDDQGRCTHLLVVSRDITDQRRAERRLRRTQYTIDKSNTPIFWIRADAGLSYVNDAACRFLGYSREELLTLGLADVHATSTQEYWEQEAWDEIRQRRTITYASSARRKDGTTVPIEVFANHVEFEGEEFVFAFVTDITQRKAAESALQYRSDFDVLISRISTDFINLPAAKIEDGVRAVLQTIGEFAHADRSYILHFHDEETLYHSYQWYAEGMEVQLPNSQDFRFEDFPWFSERIRRLEPVHIPRVSDLPEEAQAEREMLEREQVQSSIDVPIVSGGTVIGFLGFETVRTEMSWSDDAIALLRIVGEIVSNALERRRTDEALKKYRDNLENLVEERTHELQAAHVELVRSERLATLGKLTAAVSHEIRNPLGTVRNCVFSIGEALQQDDDRRATRSIVMAKKNIQRCSRIIDELVDYSRLRPLLLEQTDMDAWLAETLEEQTILAGIECQTRLASDVRLPVDREELRRAVVNVVANAAQALDEEGAGRRRLSVEAVVAKERLELRFIDTGLGMSAETEERMFEPLFSTKGFGVGLGMPIVKGIMERHEGGVEVDSREGEGTEVVLWIPLAGPRTPSAIDTTP